MQRDWLSAAGRSMERAGQVTLDFLPNLLAAAALLLLGWLVARLLRGAAYRVVPRLYRLLSGRAFHRELKTTGMERVLSDTIAGIVFW